MKKIRVNTNPHILKYKTKRNKNFPNSRLPVLIYKEVFFLPKQKNKAAHIAQENFNHNGWSNSWRNGIYDFHHYHSTTHECMAICIGSTSVILGGPKGRKFKLTQGDVLILPAGVGHKCLTASEDFLCIGAYPQGKNYDINYGTAAELPKALKKISALSIPKRDPVFGNEGFLKTLWK